MKSRHLKSFLLKSQFTTAGPAESLPHVNNISDDRSQKKLPLQSLTTLQAPVQRIAIYLKKMRSAIARFTISLLNDSYHFLQNYKQTEFTGNVGEYEKRKQVILFQMNRFQLLLGLLMPVTVFFSEKNIPFLSALIFVFPPLANTLVLYLQSKQRTLEAMIAYFVLYPFFTNLAYVESFSQGVELFFVLYCILSVFFLHQLVYITICLSFNAINYFLLVLLMKGFNTNATGNYPFFFVVNHLVAISVIMYSLYLIKKENAGHQASMLGINNELAQMNEEVSRQKEEIAKKAKQLEEQAERLKQLDFFKSRLFSIVSHDLKAPLYALRNLFQEVETQKLSADEVVSLIPDVLKDLNFATGLTENLLSWAKNQMQAETVSPHEINVRGIVNEVVQLLRLQAELKEIRIKSVVNSELRVFADGDMTKLVLRNLLSNAIKFTPRGGSVFIDANAMGSHVEIIVRDTGEGMDTASLERIRNSEYFTTRGTADEQGTGLGLMLCKEFVVKNKGTLHIESAKGSGSTFSFTLPSL